jgi:hypothetical protein
MRRLKLWLNQRLQSSKKLIREYSDHCLLKDENRANPEFEEFDDNDQTEAFEIATNDNDEIKTFENVTSKRRGKLKKKRRKKKNVSHGQEVILDDVGIISDRKEERHDSHEQFKMGEKDYSNENDGTALPVRLISSPVYSSSSSCPTLNSVTLMSARFIALTQQEETRVKEVLSPFNDEITYYLKKRLDREKYFHKIKKPKKIVTNTEGDVPIVKNFNIIITKGTICRLRPGCWLDDEVKITI